MLGHAIASYPKCAAHALRSAGEVGDNRNYLNHIHPLHSCALRGRVAARRFRVLPTPFRRGRHASARNTTHIDSSAPLVGRELAVEYPKQNENNTDEDHSNARPDHGAGSRRPRQHPSERTESPFLLPSDCASQTLSKDEHENAGDNAYGAKDDVCIPSQESRPSEVPVRYGHHGQTRGNSLSSGEGSGVYITTDLSPQRTVERRQS
jgi:hypothetical protein